MAQEKSKSRSSMFFNKKSKKPSKSTSSASSKSAPSDDHGFNGGDPFTETVDFQHMGDKEVDKRFEQLLDDMNLTEEKKAPLRSKDGVFRRQMLQMHVRGVTKSKGGELDTPQAFIISLMDPDLKGGKRLQVLEALRVSLTSKPVSWVKEFGERGLNAILRNLTYCCDNTSERRSTYECVRCLKAFMNNKFGLMSILDHEEALTIMSRTVDPSDPPTMLEAVRLLAAMCLVPPNGHEKVLEGLTVCGEIRSQERFVPIISGLAMRDNPAMQVACIQVVNAIVFTPDDIDFRMHLRNEFMRTGLIDLLEWLDNQEDEELKTHVKIFHEHKEEDQEEFSHRYDNISMEIEYPFKQFQKRILQFYFIYLAQLLLLRSVGNTVAEPYFLSILQHLLLIRDDIFARPQYYKLIEECITQIVLHRSGCDPDFRQTKRFDIDVEPLLVSLSDRSKFEDPGEISIADMTAKLDTALTAKQESEAKATSLESKVQQYELELTQLKEKISQSFGSSSLFVIMFHLFHTDQSRYWSKHQRSTRKRAWRRCRRAGSSPTSTTTRRRATPTSSTPTTPSPTWNGATASSAPTTTPRRGSASSTPSTWHGSPRSARHGSTTTTWCIFSPFKCASPWHGTKEKIYYHSSDQEIKLE
ncbi:unnamed protein product [Lymnaea stagnalis]|uniref:GBD/FH3 domain-containing protein n=1 Tax=Lymnaea stagnalis TaxID=6523 RepID=A0AAV2GZJ0_LYMST